MRSLNNITKVAVIVIVIGLFIMVVTSCAYVGRDGNVTINIDRKLDIDSNIETTNKTEKKK